MKPHILIVDDDLELQALFRMILGRSFEISQAVCGEQAVTSALDSIPDLVLLDVMLPDIDGFEVCRRLTADARTCAMPIIFVTARADISAQLKELNLSADSVIKKPFTPRDLLHGINMALQKPAMSQESGRLQPSPVTA